jgi:CHAT domain-containing protein
MDYQSKANDVYNIILAPILVDYKQAKRLVIIPDKQLGFIPFDALVTNIVESPKYNSLAYLLGKYTLMQHQTVGLYIDPQHLHEKTAEQFIGFAPNFNENDLLVVANNQLRSVLRPLPFAKKEVEAISSLLDGEEVTGPSASETNLKTKAASYNILHLATHAIIDEENSLNSKLIFAHGDSTTNEDGELHSFEIYGMKLNCALVTLSACNTGTGKYLDGEGIFSLGRSFLLAGAESVLTSLWEVSDQSTSQIMESFYTNIKKGDTSPEAIRKAKLKYLKNADPLTANPHYWAGFVYIGQDENVYGSNRIYYWTAAFMMLFIGITFLTIKLNQRNSIAED